MPKFRRRRAPPRTGRCDGWRRRGELAGAGDEFDRHQAVGRHAQAARIPPQAATQGVPGDADVDGRAVQHRQAVRGRGVDGRLPDDSAADAPVLRSGSTRISSSAPVRRMITSSRTAPRADRRCARSIAGDLGPRMRAARTMRTTPHAFVGDAGRRPLVDGKIPGDARLVVVSRVVGVTIAMSSSPGNSRSSRTADWSVEMVETVMMCSSHWW